MTNMTKKTYRNSPTGFETVLGDDGYNHAASPSGRSLCGADLDPTSPDDAWGIDCPACRRRLGHA